MTGCMWAVCLHLDTMDKARVAIESGVLPTIMKLLKAENKDKSITVPAIRIIGAISTGTE